MSITRDQLKPGHKVERRRHHHRAAPDHRGRARLAGRDRRAKNHLVLDAREEAQARARHRHPCRPGDAGSVQQSVHVDRRADGRVAAEHRLFGQHQGAARFLLRGVRADGTLVANAPHMPVHLGSMDRAVETIIRENKGRIAPGDVYAINAPYNGGTHLPDITVCTPVFDLRELHPEARPRPASIAGGGQGLKDLAAPPTLLRKRGRGGGEASRRSCSGSPRAGITPMSAASRPARCRPTPPPSSRKASISTISSWSTAAASARRN